MCQATCSRLTVFDRRWQEVYELDRSTSFQRLAMISIVVVVFLAACRPAFQVWVTDFRGGARPSFYEGEPLKMYVHWDREDRDKAVNCQVVDTFTGETNWKGQAIVPAAETGALQALVFDSPLPQNGQFGLRAGTYEWACDLDAHVSSSVYFDIVAR